MLVTRRGGTAAAAAALALVTAGSSAQLAPGSSGTIVLRAGVIEISAAGITATGSPVITSSQGTVAAPQFNVLLDPQGRASEATATGGVHFSLAAATGSYRTITGTCDRITLFPSAHEARLIGSLSARLEGPRMAPARITGASAQLFGAVPGRPAHIDLVNAVGDIPSHS
ncbi:MAG: hypothetical protein LC772_11220 [Chloroflexi bacterium]|nr:hypothetical protein [Chloroflexota bacterium]